MKDSNNRKANLQLYPVLAGYFIMAFSDLVAPITPRIAAAFPESLQPWVSFFPTMVFLWFLLLSIPIAIIMKRIGRRRTALWGDALAAVGLLVAYLAGEGTGLGYYFVGFGLLGIGCTAIQVSVNPMLAMLAPNGKMSMYLTLGQVFRNTALMLLAPIVSILTLWTGSWRLLLPFYALLTVIGGIWMAFTRFDEPEVSDRKSESVGDVLRSCGELVKNPIVALCAIAIGAYLMLDVGIGYLSVQLVDSPNPLLTTTGFYACRIVASLVGVWALTRFYDLKYLWWNMAAATVACVMLFFLKSAVGVYLMVGILGFALACIFSTFFAAATRALPERANELSGLLILTISAGALSAPIIGAIIRSTGSVQAGVWYLIPCVVYLWWASWYVGKCEK